MAKKLVVIDACIRQNQSRTWRIAEPIVEALMERYETTIYHLPEMEEIVPLNPGTFWERGNGQKAFFEQTSLFNLTFADDGTTCVGLCRCEKVLYITTRGMDIPTGDPREQGSPYIGALSSLWGLGEVVTLAATGMDYAGEDGVERKISEAVREGLAIASDF